jgi:chromate transporter
MRGPTGSGLSHGLALVAVAIVAQAVWGMARTLCPDARRAAIACASFLIILIGHSSFSQIAGILFGGIAGLWLCRAGALAPAATLAVPVSRSAALASLAIFSALAAAAILLQGVPLPSGVALFNAFYRSGALVFGGGHVVLPLLRDAFVTPGWISDAAFLAGYGAAQAVPGPLFSFAAYLGAAVDIRPHGLAGAALGLIGIFLPGMLILIAALPFWGTLRARTDAQALMRGINASVVGLLAAALYDPVWSRSVMTPADAAVALLNFALLTFWRAPPLLVVVLGALAGIGLSLTRATFP